jgi:hypothetical protein
MQLGRTANDEPLYQARPSHIFSDSAKGEPAFHCRVRNSDPQTRSPQRALRILHRCELNGFAAELDGFRGLERHGWNQAVRIFHFLEEIGA